MLKPLSSQVFKAGLLAIALSASGAYAIEHDFSQLIKVQSQFTNGDGIEKSLLYSGNVRIVQGTLVIEADEVEVLAKEGPGKEIFIARGQPAKYQQTKEDGTLVSATANEIRYLVSGRVLTLEGAAELQQNSSQVKGESIRFDMQNETVNAAGTDDQGGRVTTIFQPATTEKTTQPTEQESDDDGNP